MVRAHPCGDTSAIRTWQLPLVPVNQTGAVSALATVTVHALASEECRHVRAVGAGDYPLRRAQGKAFPGEARHQQHGKDEASAPQSHRTVPPGSR